MKIAVTSSGPEMDSIVDARFGRAKYFTLIDIESGEYEVIDNKQNLNASQGAGIQAGQNVVDLGVEAVITGNVGPKAFRILQAAKIKVLLCKKNITVAEAIDLLKAGDLEQVDQANVEGHWA